MYLLISQIMCIHYICLMHIREIVSFTKSVFADFSISSLEGGSGGNCIYIHNTNCMFVRTCNKHACTYVFLCVNVYFM